MRDIPDKPFSELSRDEKGTLGENRVIERLERSNEPYIDLARMREELAWMPGRRDFRCPDFMLLSLPRNQAIEAKARGYATSIGSFNEPHIYIRQDRMDDYLRFSGWCPVILHVFVDEEGSSYWQYVSKLEGLSNHEQLEACNQHVDSNDVYWFPLAEFNPHMI